MGIVGSLLATYGGRLLGLYDENSAAGFIASVIGAIIVLFIYNMVSKKITCLTLDFKLFLLIKKHPKGAFLCFDGSGNTPVIDPTLSTFVLFPEQGGNPSL